MSYTVKLTAEQRTLYETRLTEAETAWHDLMIGGQLRVGVDQNGERAEFTVANAGRLRAYIMDLKLKLGKPTGVVGPMQPWMIR